MRVDAPKPTFTPVVLTLESEQEVQFLTNVVGFLRGTEAAKMGLPTGWNSDTYSKLASACAERGIAEATYPLNIEVKE